SSMVKPRSRLMFLRTSSLLNTTALSIGARARVSVVLPEPGKPMTRILRFISANSQPCGASCSRYGGPGKVLRRKRTLPDIAFVPEADIAASLRSQPHPLLVIGHGLATIPLNPAGRDRAAAAHRCVDSPKLMLMVPKLMMMRALARRDLAGIDDI